MSSILWDVTQRRFVVSYRCFWTAYWSYLQGLRRQTNYQQTSRDNPEEWRPQNTVYLTASVNKFKRQRSIFQFPQSVVSTEHGKPSLSYKTENTAELKYMTASVTRRLDRHVANICHAFCIAPFCYTINCRWLSFGFSFQTHFISTQNKKLSVVLTVSYLKCRITVSYLQCRTYSVVLAVSHLQCRTYSVVLTNTCNKRQDNSFSIYIYSLHYGKLDGWDI